MTGARGAELKFESRQPLGDLDAGQWFGDWYVGIAAVVFVPLPRGVGGADPGDHTVDDADDGLELRAPRRGDGPPFPVGVELHLLRLLRLAVAAVGVRIDLGLPFR